jgi:hypothetical protein
VSQASAAAAVVAMVELRGGHTASDPRLGRLPEFDDRSRRFAVRELLDMSKPVRSKSWSLNIWLDQGNSSACVGFSRTYDLAAVPTPIRKPDGSLLDNEFGQALYHLAQKYDQWEGEEPVYEGSSVLGGLKALRVLGFVGEYRWAFSREDFWLALSYLGPVVLGTVWLNSMFNPKPNGLLTVDVGSGEAGGHAYVANSIKVTKQAKRRWLGPDEFIRDEPLILGRNSWGRDWGKDGHWAMWASDVERLRAMDGDASIVTKAFKRGK